MATRPFALCCIAAVSLLAPAAARATTARYLDLPTLVDRSDAVVLGEVLQRDSFWQGPKIYTLARLRVHQGWRGKVRDGSAIDVLTPGGQVGELGQEVGGAARLPLHALMVLHLRETSTGEFIPVGMAQGAWQVVVPPPPGSDAAVLPASGAGLLDAVSEKVLRVVRPGIDRLVEAPADAASTLPTTLAQLRQAVREAPGGPR